jgi:membrane-associated phospholipid phosphatase
MLRGIAAGAVMFLAGFLGNRFLKISMHMMFAAFCTVALAREIPSSLFATLPFVAALAWSRRHLDRHTWPEIAAGLVIGTLCSLAAGS